jgi:hypothetical protein
MEKKINFRARSKDEFDIQTKPYPAVKKLPKWFMNQVPYESSYNDEKTKDGKIHVRNRESNATFKKCTPMLDALGSGYIIPLWSDVEIQEGIVPEIHWRTYRSIFELHNFNSKNIETPSGYNSQVFKYSNCWIPQTPKGYSCLITSPFGYSDLPFKSLNAIVDTDKSTLELLIPVWVKDNFSGIVEKGTPIAQIIPFKRDNWEATFDYYENDEYRNIIEEKNFNTTIVSHYIKNVWSKKNFK